MWRLDKDERHNPAKTVSRHPRIPRANSIAHLQELLPLMGWRIGPEYRNTISSSYWIVDTVGDITALASGL